MPRNKLFKKRFFTNNKIDWCVFGHFSEQKVLQFDFFHRISFQILGNFGLIFVYIYVGQRDTRVHTIAFRNYDMLLVAYCPKEEIYGLF